jgi:D-alanyl-D-alanine carboxypeptidase (penicillin-binding protein 5/6)
MGFNNYQLLTLMKAGAAVPQEVTIKGGEVSAVSPVLARPAQVFVKRADAKEVKYSLQVNNPVWAPLKKGDKLGELFVTLGKQEIGKFPLVSDHDINQSNIVKRLWDRVF